MKRTRTASFFYLLIRPRLARHANIAHTVKVSNNTATATPAANLDRPNAIDV
jgi:hypothetical protein